MQLTIDLTGREVLVTGSDAAARQAVTALRSRRRRRSRLSRPHGTGHNGPLPERPFLVAVVDDGQPGWEPCSWTAAAPPASRSPPNLPPAPPGM